MRFQRPHGGYQNDDIRLEPRYAALDVEELLHTHLGPEPRFRHHVVGQVQSDPIGQDGGITVGDVGERPRMDQGRLAFEGLHQRRVQGVPW